jgi:tetrahydromethanopterin S-methyltransferase subunit G
MNNNEVKELEIPRALNALNFNISTLEEKVDFLVNRLAKCINSVEPEIKNPMEAKPKYNVELANEIDELTRRIENIDTRLQNVLDKLEI